MVGGDAVTEQRRFLQGVVTVSLPIPDHVEVEEVTAVLRQILADMVPVMADEEEAPDGLRMDWGWDAFAEEGWTE